MRESDTTLGSACFAGDESMTHTKLYPYYLLLLSALLYLPGLGARDFWAPVEPRYAEIARVMFVKNEWIVPSVNGALYTDKPILYFWLVLIFSKIAGAVSEWTVRLPAALGGFGAVLATYQLGKDFFSARVGFVAGVVLATSVRVVWEARWAHLDMLFTFFFTLAMLFALRVFLKQTRRHEIFLFYALLALATLTKGLIGVVLPGLILGSYVIVTRDWRLIGKARLPQGAAVFLLIAAPWFVLVTQATGGMWLRDFIYIHHVQRYTDGFGHREPFYYYFTTLPVDLLPWTLFAFPALFAYRPDRTVLNKPVALFFTLWFLLVFLFFTVSDTKRDLYLLPLLPVVSLFTAVYLDDLLSGRLNQHRWERALSLFFFGLLAIGCIVLPVGTWLLRREAFWISLPVAVTLGAAAFTAIYFAWRRSLWPFFWSVTVTMVVGVMAASIWVLPYVDRYKSPRPLSLAVNRIVSPGAPLYVYADTMNDYNFYMKREVIPIIPARRGGEELLRAEPGFLLIRERDFERLRLSLEGNILLEQPVGGENWYLLALPGSAARSSTTEP
jgi:4-amino-4-deoxy-L-arabinose transferase-like glycosyltransferase